MFKLTLILAALAFAPLAFAGEIYKWTDANGNVHFGDRANSNAKKVDVRPTRPLPAQRYTTTRRAKGKIGAAHIIARSQQH